MRNDLAFASNDDDDDDDDRPGDPNGKPGPNGKPATHTPATKGGRVLKVTFANGQPQTPTTIATGLDFPTSATVCVPGEQTCPVPRASRK